MNLINWYNTKLYETSNKLHEIQVSGAPFPNPLEVVQHSFIYALYIAAPIGILIIFASQLYKFYKHFNPTERTDE